MTRKSSRPTMDDVAARAGVSQMTVSRVLNKKGYVSSEVRARVIAAARELGYVQNRIAWSLRSEATSLIAAILPTLDNRVFTEVLSGINDAAAAHRLQVAFAVSEYSPAREEQVLRDVLSWQPRGVILAGLEHSEAAIAALKASGVACAEIMDLDGPAFATAIGFGQREAGAQMARYLLVRGYRCIACIGSQGGLDLRAAKRLEGFAQVIREAGAQILSVDISPAPSSMNEGRRMTREILSRPLRPDAIYYSNDDLAAGGLMHCIAENIPVPADIALAGCNGLAFLEALPLRLTTTETPRYEIGQRAVDALAAEPTNPTRIDLGFRLIIGETT